MTGAANSHDGKHVAVRTFSDAYEWSVTNGDVVGALTTGTPKITPTASTFTINQTWGGTYNDGGQTSPAAASDSWGGQYGFFAIGSATSGLPVGAAQSYTLAPGLSGAFTGGDGGATTFFQGNTNQTTGALGVACLTTGLKGVTFGIGGFTLQ